MKTKEELNRKLSGYRGAYRGRLLLLQNRILTKEEFILYEASLDFSDWDKKNRPNRYGSFDLTWKEIGLLLGWDESVVSRHSKKLFEKRFWEKREDSRIKVNGFELIEPRLLKEITAKYAIVNLQQYLANIQTPLVKQQESAAKTQADFPKGEGVNQLQNLVNLQDAASKSDLVSCKDECSVSKKKMVLIEQDVRTDEEYQKIYNEGSYEMLSIDDMRWLDKNVKQKIAIKDEAAEKDIVEIFFNGDWNEYRKHLITN